MDLRALTIAAFGPDDAGALAEWAAVENAIAAVDAPWEPEVTARIGEGRFRHGWDGEPYQPSLARIDGAAVGIGAINTSEYDNRHLAWLQVKVHPAHRRQGIGSAILAHLLAEAQRRGRTSVGIDGWSCLAADRFASRHGFAPKLTNVQSRQVVADIDWSALARRYDAALVHARDYQVETWQVPTPPERLDDLAAMASAINDAPNGDLDYEDEVFTGERMRAFEVATAGKRQRMHRLVARHRATGELAAQTIVTVESDHPERAHQEDTSVVRAHRGHRLGLVLKIAMLHHLAAAEPQIREIETWNAASNAHMIAVNDLLGYQPTGRETAYQRSLAGGPGPS